MVFFIGMIILNPKVHSDFIVLFYIIDEYYYEVLHFISFDYLILSVVIQGVQLLCNLKYSLIIIVQLRVLSKNSNCMFIKYVNGIRYVPCIHP